MPLLARRLPWFALALTLLTAAVLLLGPLWDDPRDENPLERAPGVHWDTLLLLGLPTVIVATALAAALALPRHPRAGGLAVVAMGVAVVLAPEMLTVWFLPSLLLAAVAVLLAVRQGALARSAAPGRH